MTKDTQQYHGNPLGGYNVYPAERNNHGKYHRIKYQSKNPEYDYVKGYWSRRFKVGDIGVDIKHINSDRCKNRVGFGNEKELAFARYLSNNNIHMWIRQVLVPGYTDDEQDLLQLKDFIDSLNTVDKIEVLPYHDMGRYKWEKLGLKYQLDGVRVANDDDVIRAKKLLGIT